MPGQALLSILLGVARGKAGELGNYDSHGLTFVMGTSASSYMPLMTGVHILWQISGKVFDVARGLLQPMSRVTVTPTSFQTTLSPHPMAIKIFPGKPTCTKSTVNSITRMQTTLWHS